MDLQLLGAVIGVALIGYVLNRDFPKGKPKDPKPPASQNRDKAQS